MHNEIVMLFSDIKCFCKYSLQQVHNKLVVNSNLPNTMVPPKGEVSVDITHAATGDISFQTINDYGALTPRIKATMQ